MDWSWAAWTSTPHFPTHGTAICGIYFYHVLIVQSGIFHAGYMPQDTLLENFSIKLSAVPENTNEKEKKKCIVLTTLKFFGRLSSK